MRSRLQRLEPEAFGEFVIDRKRIGLGDFLDRHREFRRLAGEFRLRVILGEGRVHHALFARDGADEPVLEAGNERLRAEHDLDVLARAAIKDLAVDLALEVDGQPVARFGAFALGALGERATRVGKPLQRSLDLALFDLGDRALERNFGEVANFELRQHLERDLERQVAARLERRLDLGGFAGQLDLGLHRQPQALDDLLLRRVESLLHHLGHHRAAIDLLQVRHRHLARAKAVDAHFALEVGELGVEFRGEVARRNDDIVFPLQPLAQRLRDLHVPTASSRFLARAPRTMKNLRSRRAEKSGIKSAVVRAKGLEPPRLWVTGT